MLFGGKRVSPSAEGDQGFPVALDLRVSCGEISGCSSGFSTMAFASVDATGAFRAKRTFGYSFRAFSRRRNSLLMASMGVRVITSMDWSSLMISVFW